MIKESQQYLVFLKNYFLILISGTLIGLLIGFWLVLGIKPQYSAQRLFEFPYSEQNAAFTEKQANEAVSVLRSNQLKEQLGIQKSTVTIYKPGAFLIHIQVANENAEKSVEALLKIVNFFSQSYLTAEVGSMTLTTVNPPFIKYLGTGSMLGFFCGFVLSLLISYFKKY